MKFAFSFMLGLWALFAFSSCSMMESLRDESAAVDAEVERDRSNDEGRQETDVYANKPRILRGLSANNVNSFDTSTPRGYGRRLAAAAQEAADSGQQEFRRATRADFVDREMRENSLWDAQGQSNYLFSNNRRRETGDMVTAEVEKELRREIQYQLWMTLPPEQRRMKQRAPASLAETAKDAVKDATKTTEDKAKDAAEEAAKTNMAATSKDDDVVRMEVVESMGNGLVRVVGQKRVIYRGVSRVVEVMALVNNKDVDDSGRVKSSNFLDMKAQVTQ